MNLSVVLFILIVVFIKYWLLLFTSPLLMAYCWLHRRKNMANPEGEVSEIRDSGITSSSCSKKLFKRIDKRGLINIVDGYFRWMIKIISDIPSHHIRDFFYKYIFLVKMEKNSVLYYGSEIRAPWMLMIGKVLSLEIIVFWMRGVEESISVKTLILLLMFLFGQVVMIIMIHTFDL